MNILISIIQLLAGLSILVILHEMGHFIFARLFNTRVEKFYLFFNPWFSIFKFKKGDTVYGLGWLPLGGYVKISGMIDESMDKEAMKEPPKPYEFRSKPAWQRLLIMIGGVLVNLLLGVLIFWMMKFAYGDIRLPNDNMHGGIWVDSLGYNVGFRNGDKIVEVDGEKVKYFEDARAEISLGYEKEVVVNRNDSLVKLIMPKGLVGKLSDRRSFLMTFRIPFVVKTVPDSSINYNAGLKENDRIVAVNGQPTRYFDEVVDILQENSGKEIVVEVASSNQRRTVPLKVSDEGFIEVIRASFANKHLMQLQFYEYDVKKYGFFESLPVGTKYAYDKLKQYVQSIGLFFKKGTDAHKSAGGFGTIAEVYGPNWDWENFWNITAFLSLILAFMNILPIPALDGGHVMFLLYEIISGRKPGDKFMEYAQMIGMIILIGLIVAVNANDAIRCFGK